MPKLKTAQIYDALDKVRKTQHACAAKKALMGKLLDALAIQRLFGTKAGKRLMFGQEMKVKAKPARKDLEDLEVIEELCLRCGFAL